MNRIVIASRNKGKIAEIRKILAMPGLRIDDLDAAGFEGEIEETGQSFRENALIKAEKVYAGLRVPVVADDSGLSVPALGGKPGVFSSRFAGRTATDAENNRALLKALEDCPDERRRAFFFCTAVFYYEEGKYCCAEGRVDGVVARKPSGNLGFGYDPLFLIPELGKTLAQLPPETKNRISHRAQAFRSLRVRVESYFGSTFPR